jgi:hypothetical protein
VQVVGSAVGLLVAGRWSDASGGFGAPMSVLVIGPLLAAALVWWRYPETRGRELEELEVVAPQRRRTATPPGRPPPTGDGSGESASGGAPGDPVMRS